MDKPIILSTPAGRKRMSIPAALKAAVFGYEVHSQRTEKPKIIKINIEEAFPGILFSCRRCLKGVITIESPACLKCGQQHEIIVRE